MKKLFLYLLLSLTTLTSCELDDEWNSNIDPDNPYEEYAGRMIDRIRIEHSAYDSDYIYYEYDRRGRITSIENTYYGTIDYFTYTEDDYDDVIVVRNNLGEDRDIYLNWDGFAESEQIYNKSNVKQCSEYSYIGDKLYSLEIENYNWKGDFVSEEEYDIDYDSEDNIKEINRYYEEVDYYIDSDLTFSGFSECYNNYNIDILSIIGLFIEGDYASQIGRAGERNGKLPTKARLSVNRNGRRDDDIIYRIAYAISGDHITTITVSPSKGVRKIYNISYK